MDPNLFRIDMERLFEVLLAIIVLAFFVERALALVFEHRLYVIRVQGKGLKEVISFLLAFLVCRYWDFDAVSVILVSESTSLLGQVVTAGIIAGGSKASIALFQDLMKARSTVAKVYAETREEEEKAKRVA